MSVVNRGVCFWATIAILCGAAISPGETLHGTRVLVKRGGVVNVKDLPPPSSDLAHRRRASFPRMPAPHNLAVPANIDFSKAVPLTKPMAVATPPRVPAQDFSEPQNFPALGDDGTEIPPDTQGAVGPTDIMVTLNSQVRIETRTGVPINTFSMASFWEQGYPTLNDIGDPRVVYDPYGRRWIFVAVAQPESSNSSILLAVSKTSDPSQYWNTYEIQADPTGQTWADYPLVGFNGKWICISINMYTNTGNVKTSTFVNAKTYAFDKAMAYSSASQALVGVFDGTPYQNFSLMPVTTYDPSYPDLPLIESWTPDNGYGNGFLKLEKLTGPVDNPSLAFVGFPSMSATWDVSAPGDEDFAPQFGSPFKIDTGDARISSACYRNGAIWAAQTVFLPAGGLPTRSAVQWWEIDPSGDALNVGRIDDPSATYFYAYPSIAVNSENDVLVGFSYFSANSYASSGFAYKGASDPPANLSQPLYSLKGGEASYYRLDTEDDHNRWGDLSESVVDPTDDLSLWTIQEYAAAPQQGLDRWGTWWGEITPGPSSPPALPDLEPYTPQGWSGPIVVSPVKEVYTTPATITPSESVYISFAVLNNGTAATASNFFVNIFVDGNPWPSVDNFYDTAPLASNYYEFWTDVLFGSFSPGTHTIEMVIDPTNAVEESNKNNNTYTLTFNVSSPSALPDLEPNTPRGWSGPIVVSPVKGVYTTPATITPSEDLYISLAVLNNGNAATASNFFVNIFVDGNPWPSLEYFYDTAPLAPNSSAYWPDLLFGTFSPGTHTIEMVIDPTNAVEESNKNNNTYTLTFTVTQPQTCGRGEQCVSPVVPPAPVRVSGRGR